MFSGSTPSFRSWTCRASRSLRLLIWGTSLAMVTGCASLPGTHVLPPQLAVDHIESIQLGLIEQHFDLILRVSNPNSFELPISGLQFRVELAETPFAQAQALDTVTLAPMGDTLVPVKITVRTSDLLAVIQAVRQLHASAAAATGNQADYRLVGSARVGPLMREVPFDRHGMLNLPSSLFR